jgi:hypothetical protein
MSYKEGELMVGIKTGIHFGDGMAVVKEFEASIIGWVAFQFRGGVADKQYLW